MVTPGTFVFVLIRDAVHIFCHGTLVIYCDWRCQRTSQVEQTYGVETAGMRCNVQWPDCIATYSDALPHLVSGWSTAQWGLGVVSSALNMSREMSRGGFWIFCVIWIPNCNISTWTVFLYPVPSTMHSLCTKPVVDVFTSQINYRNFWNSNVHCCFHFRFSPCIIIISHFYCPTNALNYTTLRG